MKRTTFFKSLLVAAALCVGASAWADADMTTMTGMLGASDNTSAAFTCHTKRITLAAGESYTYTFVNHNKGASGTNNYETWLAECTDGTNYMTFCSDGRNWGSLATNNYTGSVAGDISATATTFLKAYDGVTVTFTVSRSSDGTTLTMTHSATTNEADGVASTTYAGTLTGTGVSSEATITFWLTNELSHQEITNVVYTNSDGNITHYDLVNVDLSKFDSYGSGSYADGVASIQLAQYGWAKLDLTSYFSDIDGTITNVNLKLTNNIYSGGRFTLGVFGDNKSSWASKQAYQDTGNSVSVWGIMGSNKATRIYYNSTYATGVTYDAAAAIEVDMDVINKKFTWIQDGTTKVNNQNFVDNTISLPKYIAAYSWVAEGTASTVTNATMEIVYLETTYYSATFTNTTSGNTVNATIYTDSERTSEITNGLLEDGKTYYFTATETGYQDYEGSFTVNSADPAVNFAMTAKIVYNYTVNAVDAESGIIKSNIVSGTCYADESTSFYLPTCVLVDGTLHFMAAESSYKNETVTSNNQVFSYTYTTNTVDNVVYFVEGESISGASTSTPTGNQNLASNGKMGRGSNLSVTTLPAGSYTVYVKYINTNSSAHSLVVKAGDVDVINDTDVKVRPTKSGSVTLTESTSITLTAAASSTSGVDYLYIVKNGEVATIGATGWTTFASPYALDLSQITGATAYYAQTVNTNSVTMASTTQAVQAGEGIMLKGTANATVTIPVVATGTAISGNKLVGCTATTELTANASYYVLVNNSGTAEFQCLDTNGATIPAGKAYLNAGRAGSRLSIMFSDDAASISSVENANMQNAQYYNLNGQRTLAPQKGLYIVNGKKVVLK